MKDCGGSVNHGTGGGNAKENARCLSNAEYGDKSDEEDCRNNEE